MYAVAASTVRVAPVAVVATLAALTAWLETGSIAARDWLGYAIVAAVLLAIVLALARPDRPGAPPLAAAGALVALAAWVGLGTAWSPLPTLGMEETELAALYAVVFLVPLVTLATPTERMLAVGCVTLVIGGVAVAAAVELWREPSPAMFRGGRLYFPVTYVNAEAAFFLVAFWPAVCLAGWRRMPVLLRFVASAVAAIVLAGWLATQSKGALVALVASAAVVFALSPARLRLILPVVAAAAPVALTWSHLTAPFRASGEAELTAAASGVGRAMLVTAAVGGLLGLVYAAVDAHVTVPERARVVAARLALTAVVAATVATVAGFFAVVDDASGFAERQWDEFKQLPERESGTTHLTSLGSNRYDFWRVALNEWQRHPIGGVGTRGFYASYLQHGRSDETPARAHSLFLDVLMENGVVGLVLLLVAVGLPLVLVARRAARVPAAAALGAGSYWLVHAAGDWTWSFPAAGIPFFLLLGIALSPDVRRPLPRRFALAGAAAALLVALAFTPLWLSERYAFSALLERGPQMASDVSRAKRLNPFSVTPYVVESQIAASPAASVAALETAAEMEPRSALVRLALGHAYLRAGRSREARAEFLRARELWPRNPAIADALAATE